MSTARVQNDDDDDDGSLPLLFSVFIRTPKGWIPSEFFIRMYCTSTLCVAGLYSSVPRWVPAGDGKNKIYYPSPFNKSRSLSSL